MAYKGVLFPHEDKTIKERIENEETLFSWNTKIWSYGYGNSHQYMRVLATFYPLLAGMVFSFICALLSDVEMTKKEILTTNGTIFVVMLFFCILMRVYVLSDRKCTFLLKKSGILMIEKRFISSSSIKFIRFIGWSGFVICLVSLVYIGPIAFAGAGVFALSTIKLIGYESHERLSTIFLFDKNILFFVKGTNIIRVISDPYETDDKIYFNKSDKIEIIKKLKLYFKDIEFYDLKKSEDSYKHFSTVKAIENRNKVMQEMKSKGFDI